MRLLTTRTIENKVSKHKNNAYEAAKHKNNANEGAKQKTMPNEVAKHKNNDKWGC